jgi:hypothetical protein
MKSPGSLRALTAAPRRKDGRYDLRQLVPWFISQQAAVTGDDPLLVGDDADGWNVEFRKTRTQLLQVELAKQLGELASDSYYHQMWKTAISSLERVADKIGFLPREIVEQYREAIDRAADQIKTLFHFDTACKAAVYVWTPEAVEPIVIPLFPKKGPIENDQTTENEND